MRNYYCSGNKVNLEDKIGMAGIVYKCEKNLHHKASTQFKLVLLQTITEFTPPNC